ncbi:MAG TPA: hypothetical protein VF210_00620 [Pseudomonadales bacterium]
MRTNSLWLYATLAALLVQAAWACSREAPAQGPKGLVLVEEGSAAGPAAGDAASISAAPGPAVGPPGQNAPAGATPLEAGRQYGAGARVESGADGISFVVPDEWLGGLPPGSAAFMLGSNTRTGVGLVVMRAATSWQEIEQFLNQPQDLGDGVVLYPSSPGRRTERGYEIDLGNALYAGHAIGRLGPDNNGLVVFFGGPAAEHRYYTDLASRTAGSVVFTAPRTSGALQQWHDYLAGMMLRRQSSYYSGGLNGSYVGGSSSETLHLCRDGTYAYLSSSSVAADGGAGTTGYAGGDGGDLGQWRVEAVGDRVLLTLRSRSGEVSQHALRVQGEATYVDGERAYRVPSDRCR